MRVPELKSLARDRGLRNYSRMRKAEYNRVTGSTGNKTRIKEPKPFKPIELEQAFEGAASPIGLMENQRWMLIRSLVE